MIVNNIAVLISRILLFPRLKRKWSVNQIEIQIIEPESFTTRLESLLDALGPMMGVPQFVVTKMPSRAIPAAASPACNRLDAAP